MQYQMLYRFIEESAFADDIRLHGDGGARIVWAPPSIQRYFDWESLTGALS
jgi:hypothetical protein